MSRSRLLDPISASSLSSSAPSMPGGLNSSSSVSGTMSGTSGSSPHTPHCCRGACSEPFGSEELDPPPVMGVSSGTSSCCAAFLPAYSFRRPLLRTTLHSESKIGLLLSTFKWITSPSGVVSVGPDGGHAKPKPSSTSWPMDKSGSA